MIENVLLTGSGGFIGSNLKKYLQNKYNLLTPRSFELDLADTDAVQAYFENNKIDFIIHCASIGGARGIVDKDTTIQDNLSMVNNLINAKKINTKIILFGSGAMYGKDRNLHKINEDEINRYIPKDLYGQSKLEISKIVQKRNDILMLNIFACYGYNEKENRFPSYAINQNLKHEPIEINQNVVFDYLWVEDMEKIIEYFINHEPKNKIVNITPKDSISLKDIAGLVNKISDFKSEITIKNPVMNFEYTGDNSKLLEEIPDFKFTPIQTGLEKLYKYNMDSNKYGEICNAK